MSGRKLNKGICKRCREENAPLSIWGTNMDWHWDEKNEVKCPVNVLMKEERIVTVMEFKGDSNYHCNSVKANKMCPYKWEHIILCQDLKNI